MLKICYKIIDNEAIKVSFIMNTTQKSNVKVHSLTRIYICYLQQQQKQQKRRKHF